MVGRKHLWKFFRESNFEAQVSRITTEISKIKEKSRSPDSLVIDSKTEETQTVKQSKKKTATDIHLEIKRILENSPDFNGHKKALSVLQQAFKIGFTGKRLDKWRRYFVDYFESSR